MYTHSAPWNRSSPKAAARMQMEQKLQGLARGEPPTYRSPGRPAKRRLLRGPEPRRVRPAQPSYTPAASGAPLLLLCAACGAPRASHAAPAAQAVGRCASRVYIKVLVRSAPAFQRHLEPAAAVPGSAPPPPHPAQLRRVGVTQKEEGRWLPLQASSLRCSTCPRSPPNSLTSVAPL